MKNLPDDIKRIIWSFDRTYHVKYKTCVRNIKECKKKYILYKKSCYNKVRRCDILPFSKFVLRSYINHQYSRSLYKWFYIDINKYIMAKKLMKKI